MDQKLWQCMGRLVRYHPVTITATVTLGTHRRVCRLDGPQGHSEHNDGKENKIQHFSPFPVAQDT
jgi:hypothetical protein